jgi:DNA-binding CsgD family transcriptional regulator
MTAAACHRRLGDVTGIGRCLCLSAHLHWFEGNGGAAWSDASSAFELVESSGTERDVADACCQMAELAAHATREADAFRFAERALRLTDDHDSPVGARALAVIGAMRLHLDVDDGETLSAALDAARTTGQHDVAAFAWAALSQLHLHWARPEPALAHGERGHRYAQEHQLGALAGRLETTMAAIELRAGDWDEATRLAEGRLPPQVPGSEADAPCGPHTVVGMQARTVLAEVAVRRGDDDADDRLGQLVDDVSRTGELQRMVPVLELQVERAMTTGRSLPIASFDRLAAMVGDAPLQTGCLGGRVAATAVLCGLRRSFAGRLPDPHAAMLAGDWRGAADRYEAVGWMHDRAFMLSLLDDGDALREALAIARGLGARPLERRIARRMRQSGIRVPRGPVASTRSNPAGLTDRQIDVLELVRAGLSNADIASRLYISPRTVEHHVSGVFAKLGVSSRLEAVTRWDELRPSATSSS